MMNKIMYIKTIPNINYNAPNKQKTPKNLHHLT